MYKAGCFYAMMNALTTRTKTIEKSILFYSILFYFKIFYYNTTNAVWLST